MPGLQKKIREAEEARGQQSHVTLQMHERQDNSQQNTRTVRLGVDFSRQYVSVQDSQLRAVFVGSADFHKVHVMAGKHK